MRNKLAAIVVTVSILVAAYGLMFFMFLFKRKKRLSRRTERWI